MNNSKNKIFIIGGGPAGLFTTFLLLKSGKNNVICYEKESILGGDWSEDLPGYTHSTTVLMENSKANEIIVDSYNYMNHIINGNSKDSKTVKQWLQEVSIKPSSGPYFEIIKNVKISDIFKIIYWYWKNLNIDFYTVSLSDVYKQTKISQNGQYIFNMISNLTVDGSKGTSFGTFVDILIETIRPSSFLLGYSKLSSREMTTNKYQIWNNLEKTIYHLGGKIVKNSKAIVKENNNHDIYLQITHKISNETNVIPLSKKDKIVIASSESVLLHPEQYLMEKWAKINIPNFPPIGKSISFQFVFDSPLNPEIMNKYSVYSGMYTDWNLVSILNKVDVKNIQNNTMLIVTVIGVNYDSSFTKKTFIESSKEERISEILRQLQNIPDLKDRYILPSVERIYGGKHISNWATTGLIPNGKIELLNKSKTHPYYNIHWASFLRYGNNIISILDSAANSAVEVTKEITNKEPIKLSKSKPHLLSEYIILIIAVYIGYSNVKNRNFIQHN